jgi:hypothetical protein
MRLPPLFFCPTPLIAKADVEETANARRRGETAGRAGIARRAPLYVAPMHEKEAYE